MPEGELYNQIKYLLLIGFLHSCTTVMVTQWLKSAIKLGSIGQRLFPLLWSITITLTAFPPTLTLVGIELPPMDWYVFVPSLVLVGVAGAGGAFSIYNLWDVMREHVLQALKNKVESWSKK